MAKQKTLAPFPAPPGKKWIFTPHFRHYLSGEILYAADYGREAWCFLVWEKKKAA